MAKPKKPDDLKPEPPTLPPEPAEDAPPAATPEAHASAPEEPAEAADQDVPMALRSEAQEAPPCASELPEPPAWFRTTNAGRIYADGAVVHVAAGSCVSAATHDLAALAAAGIGMQPVAAPVVARDAYGEVAS